MKEIESIIQRFLDHINSDKLNHPYIEQLRSMLKVQTFTKYHYHNKAKFVKLDGELHFEVLIDGDKFNLFQKIGNKIIDKFIVDNVIMIDSSLEEKGLTNVYEDGIQPNSIVKIGSKTFITEDELPTNNNVTKLLKQVTGTLFDKTHSTDQVNYFGYKKGYEFILSFETFINGYTLIDKVGKYHLFKHGIHLQRLEENQSETFGQHKRVGLSDNSIEFIKSKFYPIERFEVFDVNMNHIETIGQGEQCLWLLQIENGKYELLQ